LALRIAPEVIYKFFGRFTALLGTLHWRLLCIVAMILAIKVGLERARVRAGLTDAPVLFF
jgi:hypothetical protein